MDLKDPKNQILLLITIGFLVLMYVWYARFYTVNAAELTQKKGMYQKLSSDLFAVKQKAESLEGLQAEYNNLVSRYDKVKLWLPEKKEDESFLAQLHVAAQLTNSTVLSISPQESVPGEFYFANSYLVELETTYDGLGNFFAKVVNFPFIVTISDVQLKAKDKTSGAVPGGAARRQDLTTVATFRLTTYNATGSLEGGQTP